MATYGPWVQESDYTSTAGRDTTNTHPSGTVVSLGRIHVANRSIDTEPWGSPHPPVDPELWERQFEAGIDGEGGDEPVSSAAIHVDFFRGSNAEKLLVETRQGVSVRRDMYRVQPGSFGFTPWPRPDGAVGVEFEGQAFDPDTPYPNVPAEIVGLSIHGSTRLSGPTADSTYGPTVGGNLFPPGDIPPTVLRVEFGTGGSVSKVIPSRVFGQLENATFAEQVPAGFDLYFLEDAGWEATIWAETPTFVTPFDYTSGSGHVEYGWNLVRLEVEWALRPVPYRWVFDAAPRIPRRIFPRDDGLTGGARRVWPPSKSHQWGNRVDGSGYL